MNISFTFFWLLAKIQRFIFALSWQVFLLLYFSIGVGALAVLFMIEAQFFMQLTHSSRLGYGIAAILEITKVGTNIMKQAITIANRVSRIRVSAGVQAVAAVLQGVLIVVSLFCCVVVISSYLDGSAFNGEAAFVRDIRQLQSLQPLIASTLNMLEEGLHIQVNISAFISVSSAILSGLFQGIVYSVFGHLLATQSHEIEHIFAVKMERIDVKKNCTLNV